MKRDQVLPHKFANRGPWIGRLVVLTALVSFCGSLTAEDITYEFVDASTLGGGTISGDFIYYPGDFPPSSDWYGSISVDVELSYPSSLPLQCSGSISSETNNAETATFCDQLFLDIDLQSPLGGLNDNIVGGTFGTFQLDPFLTQPALDTVLASGYVQAIPEPSTGLSMLFGAAGLWGLLRYRYFPPLKKPIPTESEEAKGEEK
jgi:hypothetical protein